MRRIAILALLFLGMQLILPLAHPGQGAQSETLLIFGFLILAAYTSGEIVKLVRLPKITGYLFAGLVFGPYAMGTVSSDVVIELEPVSRLAIALIAFLAGAELRWGELKERGKTILAITGTELLFSFTVIVAVLLALTPYVPFLQGGTWVQAFALAALFAAVAIVHSPAVTMALLSETGARGPVARTTLGIVLVADVVVVLAFSFVLTLVKVLVPSPTAIGGLSPGILAWEIGGSVLVGAVLGGVVALYMRFVQRELFLFAIVVAFFGAELARIVHVETLLTLLVAGFVTENVSKHGRELLHAMERSAAPVFVIFFALAGASVHVTELRMLWPLALAIVAARAFGIWSGTRVASKWVRAGEMERRNVWLGLVSQAGVAIGLSSILASAYPVRGEQMRTLLLAVITINEIVGQVLFRIALARSGEIAEEPAAAGATASTQPAA